MVIGDVACLGRVVVEGWGECAGKKKDGNGRKEGGRRWGGKHRNHNSNLGLAS